MEPTCQEAAVLMVRRRQPTYGVTSDGTFFFCESPVTVLEELQKENGVQRKIAASDKRRFM
jgi:hypothetical protein